MAGSLKPDVPDLGEEATYTVNSYVFYSAYAKCPLFDGKVSGWRGGSDAYWLDTHYLDITLNDNCNIYRLSQSDYYDSSHQTPFTINKYVNGVWVDVTQKYEQVFIYSPSTWVKTISKLTKGRYKFTAKQRMDAEWYIECSNINSYLYLKDSAVYGVKAVG